MTRFEAATDLKIILATEIVAGWMAGANSDPGEQIGPDLETVSAVNPHVPPEPNRDGFLQHLLSCSSCRVRYAQIGLMETWQNNSVTWSLRHVRKFSLSNLSSAKTIAGKIRTFLSILKVKTPESEWEAIPLYAEATFRPMAPLHLDAKGRLVIQAEFISRSPVEISFSLEANWAALDLCSTIVSERFFYAIVDLSCCPGPAMTLDWNCVKIRTRALSRTDISTKSSLVSDSVFSPIDLDEIDACMQPRKCREKSAVEDALDNMASKAKVLVRYINAYSAGNQGWIPQDAYEMYVEHSLHSFAKSDDVNEGVPSSDVNMR